METTLPLWLVILLNVLKFLVPSGVALYVGNQIKKKLDNEKGLREIIISEIKDIRLNYRTLINDVNSGDHKPLDIKRRLSELSTKATDTITLLNKKYSVDKSYFLPYQLELNKIITDDEEFIDKFKENQAFTLTKKCASELSDFSKKYDHLFNDLIFTLFVNNKKK